MAFKRGLANSGNCCCKNTNQSHSAYRCTNDKVRAGNHFHNAAGTPGGDNAGHGSHQGLLAYRDVSGAGSGGLAFAQASSATSWFGWEMEGERVSVQAMKTYPDISNLIKAKEAQRRALAALPFEKKIELVFKLQKRRQFVKSGQPVRRKSRVADK